MIIARSRRLFKADAARIIKFPDRMFLILGWNRRTENEWYDSRGEHYDFDYLKEEVVASGSTRAELWRSVREYRFLCLLNKVKDPVKRWTWALKELK